MERATSYQTVSQLNSWMSEGDLKCWFGSFRDMIFMLFGGRVLAPWLPWNFCALTVVLIAMFHRPPWNVYKMAARQLTDRGPHVFEIAGDVPHSNYTCTNLFGDVDPRSGWLHIYESVYPQTIDPLVLPLSLSLSFLHLCVCNYNIYICYIYIYMYSHICVQCVYIYIFVYIYSSTIYIYVCVYM